MINKVNNISTTEGMTKDELQKLLDSGLGVFIVDTLEKETRFVFAAHIGYRIKFLGDYNPNKYSKAVKKLLSRTHDTIYEGSILHTYYEHLLTPMKYHQISIVNAENIPVTLGGTSMQSLKDFK